mmetsp:Transcript_41178/g.106605  ORF Transcript_41178/g.106605 Transcript_41178/m.106605 type:complete len:227 (-) Transcript_41178:466-1146(-)
MNLGGSADASATPRKHPMPSFSQSSFSSTSSFITSGNVDAMSAAASARCVGVATLGGASTRYRVNIVPAAIALASSMLAELPRICTASSGEGLGLFLKRVDSYAPSSRPSDSFWTAASGRALSPSTAMAAVLALLAFAADAMAPPAACHALIPQSTTAVALSSAPSPTRPKMRAFWPTRRNTDEPLPALKSSSARISDTAPPSSSSSAASSAFFSAPESSFSIMPS